MTMSVKVRQQIERSIATTFVRSVLAAGYTMTVDYGDGESEPLSTEKAALAAMFLGDDDRVYIYRGKHCIGWAWFVYGNDGWDVLSDYTVNLDDLKLMAETEKAIEKFENGDFKIVLN